MDRPTLSANNAVRQAGVTLCSYLSQALREIDERLGEGYAVGHPELVAACVKMQAMDFGAATLSSALYDVADAIRASGEVSEQVPPALHAIAEAVDGNGRTWRT